MLTIYTKEYLSNIPLLVVSRLIFKNLKDYRSKNQLHLVLAAKERPLKMLCITHI